MGTLNKLTQKLNIQCNKFQSIVNDQMQILQLTQELNDDQVVPQPQQQQTIECMDEYYLYKEEVDKNYILRVHEFEAKQKKELDAFRTDLHALKRLKLEIKKKNVSASRSNTSSPNRSPAKQKDVLTKISLKQRKQHATHSQSASAVLNTHQIDMLTGDQEQQQQKIHHV